MYVFSFYAPMCYYLRVNALYWMKHSGRRNKAPADRQDRDVVAFYGLMDGPYRWLFSQSWQTKGGGSDLRFCFVFIRRLIYEWVGWNPAVDVMSRKEVTRNAVAGYHRFSVTHDPPWQRLVATPNCLHGILACLSTLMLGLLYSL